MGATTREGTEVAEISVATVKNGDGDMVPEPREGVEAGALTANPEHMVKASVTTGDSGGWCWRHACQSLGGVEAGVLVPDLKHMTC